MSLAQLTEMSNRYGKNDEIVLAGGGNTSYKENGVMFVKGSGTSLASIRPEQFVKMDMPRLAAMLDKRYPAGDDVREAAALADMMAARLPGEEQKRPSVEAILHAIFPYRFVLHTHPALVNGLSCGKRGEQICRELFGESAVWVPLTKPGYILATVCRELFAKNEKATGTFPRLVILQNHGIFAAADSVAEIDALMDMVLSKLDSLVAERPAFSPVEYDAAAVAALEPVLTGLFGGGGEAHAAFCANRQALDFLRSEESMADLIEPFTPDHIVYCKHTPLLLAPGCDVAARFSNYCETFGFAPKVAAVVGIGFFGLGKSQKEAETARLLFLDAMKVAVYARSFGGVNALPGSFTRFILDWEVESYRQKAANA